MLTKYSDLPDRRINSFAIACQVTHTNGKGGIRPVVYSFLNILSPQAIVARSGGGRTEAGKMLSSSETGSGDYIAQDGPAEIVPSGGREASPGGAIFQNAVQGFRGEILVQPSQVPMIRNEAEKRPGRLAPDS